MSLESQRRSAILRISWETSAGRLTSLPDAGWWARYPLIGQPQWADIYNRGVNLAGANQFLLGMAAGDTLFQVVSQASEPLGVWEAGMPAEGVRKIAWEIEIEVPGKEPRIKTLVTYVPSGATGEEIEGIMSDLEEKIRENSVPGWIVTRVSHFRVLY